MGDKKKSAAEEVTIGKDLQFIGRIILAAGAVIAVIGSALERQGEAKK